MSLVSLDTITIEQLRGLLDIREGKNLPYELWRELQLLDLVAVNFGNSSEPVMDVLTDEALVILGELR